jgi:hypothetical protein
MTYDLPLAPRAGETPAEHRARQDNARRALRESHRAIQRTFDVLRGQKDMEIDSPQKHRSIDALTRSMRLLALALAEVCEPDAQGNHKDGGFQPAVLRLQQHMMSVGEYNHALDLVSSNPSFLALCALHFAHILTGNIELQLDSDVAVSLMLTDVPLDTFDDIVMPFQAMRLRLPDRLVPSTSGRGFLTSALLLLTDARSEKLILQFQSTDLSDRFFPEPISFEEMISHKSKTYRALASLLLGLCFLVEQDPEVLTLRPVKKGRKAPQKTKREVEEPPPQVYFANPQGIWGDDLKANREYLEAKLAGRTYHKERWFRRGHWRMQRVGKGRTELRRTRVAPSWCHRNAPKEGTNNGNEED